MFADFDFTILTDPSFKEDSVREELIAPILKALGYAASPPNQIVRSPALKHPFVYIGTKKHPVNVIPDYLIKRGGINFLIIDAKSPNEEIHKGKNVEQAYSYAIHRDVRVELFALCNGYEFVLFHVSRWPEVFSFPLKNIADVWDLLVRTIGTEAEIKKVIIKPDLGLHILRLGLAFDDKFQKVSHLFVIVDVDFVARIDEETYSLQNHIEMDGIVYLATFDFPKELLPRFLSCLLPIETAQDVSLKLNRYPFKWFSAPPEKFCFVGVACRIGNQIHTNEDEDYCPFEVFNFI